MDPLLRNPIRLHDVTRRRARHRDECIRVPEEFSWSHEPVEESLLGGKTISEMHKGEIVNDHHARDIRRKWGKEIGVWDKNNIHPRKTPHTESQAPRTIEELVWDPSDDPPNIGRIERREVATWVAETIREEEVLVRGVLREECAEHSLGEHTDTTPWCGFLEAAAVHENAHRGTDSLRGPLRNFRSAPASR